MDWGTEMLLQVMPVEMVVDLQQLPPAEAVDLVEKFFRADEGGRADMIAFCLSDGVQRCRELKRQEDEDDA